MANSKWFMFRFEELEIWKLAVEYADMLYDLAKKFPKEELYSLADQLKRAAVSISNNIAEGSGGTVAEFRSFLGISVRSVLETVNIIHFAAIRGYITGNERQVVYDVAEKLIRKTRAFRTSL
jgi:four helix bundle protein